MIIKAILYNRPPNYQIMRLAGNIRCLCKAYDSQLFCMVGDEIRQIHDGNLLEIVNETRRSGDPAQPDFSPVGRMRMR